MALNSMSFLNSLSNIASKAGEFILQTVVGAPTRQIISLGLDVSAGLQNKGAEEVSYQPEGLSKVILGDKPIISKSTELSKAAEKKQLAVPIAFTLLDTLPIFTGEGKAAAKAGEKLGAKAAQQILHSGDKIEEAVKTADTLIESILPYERTFKTSLKDVAQDLSLPINSSLSNERRFGELGIELSNKVDLMRQEAVLNKAHDMSQLAKSFENLTEQELNNFTDVAQGVAMPISDGVSNATKVWDEIRTKIADTAQQLGLEIKKADGTSIPFTPKENFFPHVVPQDVLKELMTNQKRREFFLTKMVEEGSAKDLPEARSIFRKYIEGHVTKKYGHLEKAREVNFPIYEKDPRKVLFDYISFANDRLAQAHHFGPEDEIAKEIFFNMDKAGKDALSAEKYFDRITGKEIFNPAIQKVSNIARSFQIITKLGLSAIGNTGQFVNTAVRAGFFPAMKAQFQALLSPEARAFAEKAGSTRQLVDELIRESGTDRKVVDTFLNAIQFNRVELNNRTVAANAGRNIAKIWFEQLKNAIPESRTFARRTEQLKSLGINTEEALKTGKLSVEDELKAGYNLTKQTQFTANPEDLPLYWTDPKGKIITQFKNFALNQAVFMKRYVFDELKKGNLKPLIVYSVVGEVVGEVVGDTKAKIRGRERPEKTSERLIDNLLTIGGFGLVSDFYQALRFGSLTGGSQMFNFLVGPTISDMVELVQDTNTALTELKPKELEKYVLRKIPVAGPMISQHFFPTNQKYRARGGFLPEPLFNLLEGKGTSSSSSKVNLPGISTSTRKLPGIKSGKKKLPGL